MYGSTVPDECSPQLDPQPTNQGPRDPRETLQQLRRRAATRSTSRSALRLSAVCTLYTPGRAGRWPARAQRAVRPHVCPSFPPGSAFTRPSHASPLHCSPRTVAPLSMKSLWCSRCVATRQAPPGGVGRKDEGGGAGSKSLWSTLSTRTLSSMHTTTSPFT
jgi:hypothetical protein